MDSLLRREIKTALINRRSEDEATKSHPLGRSMLQWWTQKGYMLASGPSSWMKVTAIAMAGCLVSGLESWASGTRPHTAKKFHLNIWISLCLSRNPHIQWNDFCFIYKKSIAMVSLYSFTVNIYIYIYWYRISLIVSDMCFESCFFSLHILENLKFWLVSYFDWKPV
jgi:hypothetical protein